MGNDRKTHRMRRHIGLDLDNTIILYDRALERGLVELGIEGIAASGGKKRLRDNLRALPDGELLWQRLQAYVYGPGLKHAVPAPGVQDFLAQCVAANVLVCVVSHKSEFAAAAPEGPNMRLAALDWLEAQGFFTPEHGLTRQQVYFEFTRLEKVARVASLGCSHFVDDLEETFLELDFPAGVVRILYDPAFACSEDPRWQRAGDWSEVARLSLECA